jgi:hypothetical protein
VAPLAAVRRGDYTGAGLAPGGHDAVDRLRSEVGAVGEHDDGGFDVGTEGLETAAERGARPSLPVRAVDGVGTGLDRVCAENDDNLIDGARAVHAREHRFEQNPLLRGAESRRGAGSQNDRRDHRV